jgi:hypothetical protein
MERLWEVATMKKSKKKPIVKGDTFSKYILPNLIPSVINRLSLSTTEDLLQKIFIAMTINNICLGVIIGLLLF